jgi:FixJ family two-component response regulator
MTEPQSIVFVVDYDASVRNSLKSLIRSVGLQVELFGSAQEFLQSKRPDVPSCLILDIRLPGISGLDFQRKLAEAGFPFRSSLLPGMATFQCRSGQRRRELSSS